MLPEHPQFSELSENISQSLPVIHSLIVPSALLVLMKGIYDILNNAECIPLRLSWNDTYRIQTEKGKTYILRVYGTQRHSLSAIMYEIELLLHLAHQGVSISVPIARVDGQFLTKLEVPEGIRYMALFTYAPGQVPQPFPLGNAEESIHIGRSMATLHTAADSFHSSHVRTSYDLATLLDSSLEGMQSFMLHRPADRAYMQHAAETIRQQLENLQLNSLDWGPIHGDPCSANATITDDQNVTWFDFDLCGPGWRAFDLAMAYESAMRQDREVEEKNRIWRAFLKGYQEHRLVAERDLAAMHILRGALSIHFMSVNMEKAPLRGYEWYGSDGYIDMYLAELRAILPG